MKSTLRSHCKKTNKQRSKRCEDFTLCEWFSVRVCVFLFDFVIQFCLSLNNELFAECVNGIMVNRYQRFLLSIYSGMNLFETITIQWWMGSHTHGQLTDKFCFHNTFHTKLNYSTFCNTLLLNSLTLGHIWMEHEAHTHKKTQICKFLNANSLLCFWWFYRKCL